MDTSLHWPRLFASDYVTPILYTAVTTDTFSRGQMITQNDHDFIVALDKGQKDLPDKKPEVCASVFMNLITHISKDYTIQYILVMLDDLLSVSLVLLIYYPFNRHCLIYIYI